MTPTDAPLFLIAGGGDYPALVIEGARRAGVSRISLAAFEGETRQEIIPLADSVEWMRVGQMGRLLEAGKKSGAARGRRATETAETGTAPGARVAQPWGSIRTNSSNR